MLVKRSWARTKWMKVGYGAPGKYIAMYEGWFLFGILPLYIRHGHWQRM